MQFTGNTGLPAFSISSWEQPFRWIMIRNHHTPPKKKKKKLHRLKLLIILQAGLQTREGTTVLKEFNK